MNEWTAICRVQDIPPLGARRVARQRGLDVAIFRTSGDEVFALLDRCPHKGGVLSQGIVFGRQVACPLHNWTIGLDNGAARAQGRNILHPADCGPLVHCYILDSCSRNVFKRQRHI